MTTLMFYLYLQEICDNPVFIADGASRFDVQQGELGMTISF